MKIKNMFLMKMMKKFKTISKDLLFNITASFVLTGTMQLIVYPFLAGKYSEVKYGEILTIIGIVQTITATFGGALNNVRLMKNNDYLDTKKKGDFNFLLVVLVVISVLLSAGLIIILFKQEIVAVVLLLAYVTIATINSYCCVYFRLILNFKKILLQRIFGAGGFIVGVLFLNFTSLWPLPFIIAEAFQMLFILRYSELQNESYSITPLMGDTVSKLLILIVTTLSANLINYLDRLILYPILGGESVSIYSVASFFGKGLGIVMTPISGVLLSYYSSKGYKMTNKKFWSINLLAICSGFAFVIIATIVSPYITKLLYPTIYDSASEYILEANIAAIISVVSGITQAAVLKFAPTWIQLLKEGLYGVFYLVFGLFMLNKYGLQGFCIAAILANTIKLCALYFFGGIFINKNFKLHKEQL